jgi:hypothetical protein
MMLPVRPLASVADAFVGASLATDCAVARGEGNGVTRTAYPAMFLALLLVFTACGGDDPASSPSSTEGSAGTSETVAPASAGGAGTTVAVAADDSDSIRDVALDPRLTGLEVALGGTAELVDESTVHMTFEDGSSAGADPIRACAVGKSVLDEGMILIVAYPDGEKTCE